MHFSKFYYIHKSREFIASAETGKPDCDLTIEMFRRSAEALQLKYIDAVTAKVYDIGEVKNDKKARKAISELIAQISAAA